MTSVPPLPGGGGKYAECGIPLVVPHRSHGCVRGGVGKGSLVWFKTQGVSLVVECVASGRKPLVFSARGAPISCNP